MISNTPPMKGKDGTSPNVGNRAVRPFAPFEHATLFIVPLLLSYVVRRVDDDAGVFGGSGREPPEPLLGFEGGG